MGFAREQRPATAPLHEVLARGDAEAVEAAVGEWMQASPRGSRRTGSQVEAAVGEWMQAGLGDGDRVLADDGNAVRGTDGEQTPGLLVLAAPTALRGDAGGPEVAQVIEAQRIVEQGGQTREASRDAVTRQGPEVGADHLMDRVRGA